MKTGRSTGIKGDHVAHRGGGRRAGVHGAWGTASVARYFFRFAQYLFIRLDTAFRAAALIPRRFRLGVDFVLG